MSEKLKKVEVIVVSFPDAKTINIDSVLSTPNDNELGCALNKVIHGEKQCSLILVQVHQMGGGKK